jgi:hypothetical protein
VVQLGDNPPSPAPAALNALAVSPATVIGGQSATGTLTLSAAAPTGGAAVGLASANPAATVPNSVTVPARFFGEFYRDNVGSGFDHGREHHRQLR